MLAIATILIFLSVTLMFGAFGMHLVLSPRRAATRRLRDLQVTPTTYEETLSGGSMEAPAPRRWWSRFFGKQEADATPDVTALTLKTEDETGRLLLYAGFRNKSAERVYRLSRIGAALGLALVSMVLTQGHGLSASALLMSIAGAGLAGYILPRVIVGSMGRRRQHRLRLSLPDALDLLVVCVEAGMGLNQAIVRVSEELRGTHPEIADEFRLVNLEIRAGRTRTEAMRNLGDRTGVDDIISLAAMIIQTEKFGTSIARSLRVHSDSLRVERRQRAEEAAAKTTIKLIFPLLFCIFPSLFIVIIGPAAMHLFRIFSGGQVNQ